MRFLTVAAVCALASIGLSLKVNHQSHQKGGPSLPEIAQGQKGLNKRPEQYKL